MQYHSNQILLYILMDSPVLFFLQVGKADGVIHAARDELAGVVHRHFAHLVAVALPREVVVFPGFRIPVM